MVSLPNAICTKLSFRFNRFAEIWIQLLGCLGTMLIRIEIAEIPVHNHVVVMNRTKVS